MTDIDFTCDDISNIRDVCDVELAEIKSLTIQQRIDYSKSSIDPILYHNKEKDHRVRYGDMICFLKRKNAPGYHIIIGPDCMYTFNPRGQISSTLLSDKLHILDRGLPLLRLCQPSLQTSRISSLSGQPVAADLHPALGSRHRGGETRVVRGRHDSNRHDSTLLPAMRYRQTSRRRSLPLL